MEGGSSSCTESFLWLKFCCFVDLPLRESESSTFPVPQFSFVCPIFCHVPYCLFMSNASGGLVAPDGHRKIGPDYFGYYTREVIELLSRDEDFPLFANQTSEVPGRRNEKDMGKNTVEHSDNRSDSLFSNGIGTELSDFTKERLRLLLRQGVKVLSSEVDEMVDPALAMYQLQSRLSSKKRLASHTAASFNDDTGQVPFKKLKVSSPSSLTSIGAQASAVNPQSTREERDSQLGSNKGVEKENGEVGDDLQFLLEENDSSQVLEIVKKHSDELSATLGHMEQKLEFLLDAVMSKSRPMTISEKKQLQKLIQKLPPEKLDRVAEIVCRSKKVTTQSCNEIYVDLEKEDNVTLWRLFYFVEAAEKAQRAAENPKKLSCG